MPRGAMMALMPAQEVAEWAAYYGLEPFGEERADLRSAIVASTVHNVNVKSAHRKAPKHFMPFKQITSQEEFDAAMETKRHERRPTESIPKTVRALQEKFLALVPQAEGKVRLVDEPRSPGNE